MLSSVPRNAPWPWSRVPRGEVVKVFERSAPRSLIGFAQNFVSAPNKIYLPDQPMFALNDQLQQVPLGATPGVTYAAPYAIGDMLLGVDAMAGKAYQSINGGVTMVEKVIPGTYKYHVGAIIKFKDRMLFKDQAVTPGQFQTYYTAQNFNSATLIATHNVSGKADTPDNWAKNANCIVSGINSTNNTNISVCWTWPTFVLYELASEAIPKLTYLGNNIFMSTLKAGMRFIYVPPTQGAPVVVATLPLATAYSMHHVCDKLFVVRPGGELVYFECDSVIEDVTSNLTQATTYVQQVIAALNGVATSLYPPGSVGFINKWGYNRFVFGSGANATSKTHIWEVKSTKPVDTFVFKAGTTGNASTGTIGYSETNGSYAYGLQHGSVIKQLTNGPRIITCSDFRQPTGNSLYNGFGLILDITKAALLASYVAVRVNGKTFPFESLENLEIVYKVASGHGNMLWCTWWNGLADFVNGQTYTVEFVPRL